MELGRCISSYCINSDNLQTWRSDSRKKENWPDINDSSEAASSCLMRDWINGYWERDRRVQNASPVSGLGIWGAGVPFTREGVGWVGVREADGICYVSWPTSSSNTSHLGEIINKKLAVMQRLVHYASKFDVGIVPLCRCGNWGSEMSSNLSEVTELWQGGAGQELKSKSV